PGRITDVIDGRRPRGSGHTAGRGVDGAQLDSTLPEDAVDDVRESAEFFAAVTEVREALRKGSA
ncbi:MAG: ABC transporter ATP-binding protein, partial [Gammaproteobacteria bacterium]